MILTHSTPLFFPAASKSKNKRFKLSLQLARSIVPEESEWSMAAVGRATFSLKKKHPETAWVKLLNAKQRVPQNMHTWWAMKEQHENDVKTLDTSLTDEAAIKLAHKKRLDNNETEVGAASDTQGEEEKEEEEKAATPTPVVPEEANAPTAVDPKTVELQKRRDELQEAQSKERAAILKFSTTKAKEIENEFEVERTKLQRNKADALQRMEKEFEVKFQMLDHLEL